MDRRNDGIVCRRCQTLFPLTERNCPECGTAVRSLPAVVAVIAIGVFVISISLSPLDLFSALVGAVLIGVGVFAVRDRRERIREAARRR